MARIPTTVDDEATMKVNARWQRRDRKGKPRMRVSGRGLKRIAAQLQEKRPSKRVDNAQQR